LKRLRQRTFIDETAPRRIDENCVAPHHRQLLGANQISRIVRQRCMQCDNVTAPENCREVDEARREHEVGRKHSHSQALCAARHCLAESTKSDNAESRTRDVANGMGEETELFSTLPRSDARARVMGSKWMERK
jgi:hypothetical protein